MKGLHMVAYTLLVIGGLNWLVQGIAKWDIGQLFGGADSLASRIIYVLVGIAAVVEVATHTQSCKHCVAPATPMIPPKTM